MNAAIWPLGVTVRDFVFIPRKTTRSMGHFLPPVESLATNSME